MDYRMKPPSPRTVTCPLYVVMSKPHILPSVDYTQFLQRLHRQLIAYTLARVE